MNQLDNDQYYLEKAPIPKAILHLCVPMILAMSANVIYSIVNAYFIGTLHDTAMLTAITVGLPVLSLSMAIGGVFGVGGGTFISRLMGEKNTADIRHVSSFSFYAAILAGVVIALICLLFINPIVHFLGTDSLSFKAAKDYAGCLLLFLPVMTAAIVTGQFVRSIGAARESMYGMLIGVAANCVFDVIFILVLHLNVTGAALAVGLSNLASLLYFGWFLRSKKKDVSLDVKDIRFSKRIMMPIFSIGMSEIVMSSFMIVSVLLFSNFAVLYSDDVIAALGVSQRIVQIPELLCMGVFFGIMPLLGYAYGSKDYARLKKAIWFSVVAIAGSVLLFSGTLYLFRDQILHWFSQSTSVISMGVSILTALLVSSLFNGFTGLLIAYFQSTNKPVQTMVISVVQGVLFIPVIFIAHAFLGLKGIIWSMTITEATTFILGIALILFSRKRSESIVVSNRDTGNPVLVMENE